MGYVFISYSTKNKDEAISVKNLFEKHGINTWMAPNDIPVGRKYAEVIGSAIKNCACLALLLSNSSLNSIWVAKEVERAINYRKTLIPLQLEDVVLNEEFELYISTDQILPVRRIDESLAEIQHLIATVKSYISTQSSPEAEVPPEDSLPQSESTDPTDTETVHIGDMLFGKYKILDKLTAGSTGDIFRAFHEYNRMFYTLKIIDKRSELYERFTQNLASELTFLNRLSHPGILDLVDIIDAPEQLVIVTRGVNGQTLSQVIGSDGVQNEARVLDWALQLCDIIQYLHSHSPAIFHNELHPGNILLTVDGHIKLLDSGTAQKAGGILYGNRLASAFFTAPELSKTGKADERTDIYAIGATLYALLTGNDLSRPPYVIYPLRQKNPDLTDAFKRVVEKCMEQTPCNRYQSVDALIRDLEAVSNHKGSAAAPTLLDKFKSLFGKKNNPS